MEIHEVTKKDENEWDEYVINHPESTFFHKLGWRNVVSKAYGHKPIYLIARGDGEIRGILPMFLMKSRIFGKKLVSVPFAPYGGVCADNRSIEAALVEKAKEITQELDADYLELRYLHRKSYPQFIVKLHYTTSVLELDPNPEVVWREKLKKNKRKTISKSKKQDLTFNWTNRVDNFYRLFSHNMRDLGTPVHSKVFFKTILEEFPNNSKILEVKRDDNVIYAAFYLFYRDRMINCWSSTLRKYRRFLPTDFGIWVAIEYGCENGFKYYDFGRSQVNSSNFEFKRRWGAKATPLYYLCYLNGLSTVPDITSSNPKRQKFAKTWRKMPILISNILGPKIRRHIP